MRPEIKKILVVAAINYVVNLPVVCYFILILFVNWMLFRLTKDETRRCYIMNILVGYDQTGNALLAGSPDKCISTRAYEHYPRLAKMIDLFMGRDHCKQSAANEDDSAVTE